MKELLDIILLISLPTFIVASMLTLGFSLTFQAIIKPLTNIKLVLMALGINFIIMPLLTLVIVNTLNIDDGVKIALIILSMAAGAPFLPKLAEIAKADVGESIGIMILLMVGTIFYLPIVLPLILKGTAINPVEMAQSLVVLMLIPLFGALIMKRYFPQKTDKLVRYTKPISNIALLLAAGSLVVINIKSVISLIGIDLIAITLFMIVAIGVGYIFGGKKKDIMSLSNGQRNVSAAMIVITQNFSETPTAIVATVVIAVYGIVIMFPFAGYLNKKKS